MVYVVLVKSVLGGSRRGRPQTFEWYVDASQGRRGGNPYGAVGVVSPFQQYSKVFSLSFPIASEGPLGTNDYLELNAIYHALLDIRDVVSSTIKGKGEEWKDHIIINTDSRLSLYVLDHIVGGMSGVVVESYLYPFGDYEISYEEIEETLNKLTNNQFSRLVDNIKKVVNEIVSLIAPSGSRLLFQYVGRTQNRAHAVIFRYLQTNPPLTPIEQERE